jgi:hypothetical protein
MSLTEALAGIPNTRLRPCARRLVRRSFPHCNPMPILRSVVGAAVYRVDKVIVRAGRANISRATPKDLAIRQLICVYLR